MRDKPRNRLNITYSKILLLTEIPENKILIKDLLKLCDQIRDVSILFRLRFGHIDIIYCFILKAISDRLIVNNLLKFTTILSNKNADNEPIQEKDGKAEEEGEDEQEDVEK